MNLKFEIVLDIPDNWQPIDKGKPMMAILSSNIQRLGIAEHIQVALPLNRLTKYSYFIRSFKQRFVNIDDSDIQDLKNGGDKLIKEHPNSLFVIDDDPTNIKKIRNENGILCVCWDELDDVFDYLSQPIKYFHLSDSSQKSWSDLVEPNQYLVTNSLLIVDQYFFASNEASPFPEIIDGLVDLVKSYYDAEKKWRFPVWILYNPETFKIHDDGTDEMKKIAKPFVYKKQNNDGRKKDEKNKDDYICRKYFKKHPERVQEVVAYIENRVKEQINSEISTNVSVRCIPVEHNNSCVFHDRRIYSTYGHIIATHYLNNINTDQDLFICHPFSGAQESKGSIEIPSESVPIIQQYRQLVALKNAIGEDEDREHLPLFHEAYGINEKPIIVKVVKEKPNGSIGKQIIGMEQIETEYRIQDKIDRKLQVGDIIMVNFSNGPKSSDSGRRQVPYYAWNYLSTKTQ